MGKDIQYPTLVIPYHSSFRKFWNLFIILVIIYEMIWYPVSVSFLFNKKVSHQIIAFEIAKFFLLILDLIINMRTTYSNENNEEIVDPKMLRQSYMKSKYFTLDIITIIPFSEILLISLSSHNKKYAVYSLFKLIGLLRTLKLSYYSNNIRIPMIFKVLRTFGMFFLLVSFCPSTLLITTKTHWLSCVWYLIVRAQYNDGTTDTSTVWLPVTLRSIMTDTDSLLEYYQDMPIFNVY